jgi:predicted ArsR family transcriptional regulator
MSNFPPLRMAVLHGLVDLKANLKSLDDPSCPYDEETKKTLRDLLAPIEVERVVEKEIIVEAKRGRGRPSKDVELSDEDKELLTKELTSLVEDLRNMGSGEGLETSERVQITRIKANVLDQILKMRERNTSAQKVEEFKETVINILNDLVSEKDREIFLRRLEPYR